MQAPSSASEPAQHRTLSSDTASDHPILIPEQAALGELLKEHPLFKVIAEPELPPQPQEHYLPVTESRNIAVLTPNLATITHEMANIQINPATPQVAAPALVPAPANLNPPPPIQP